MRIGILGGTFNPPHIGHMVLAQELLNKLRLDKILFVPTNIPPHKEAGGVSARDRLAMVKLAVSSNNRFEAADLEIKRGGVSYTVDTVKELREMYPGDDLYLIVGSDLANAFYSWKDFDDLKKLAKITVAVREKNPLALGRGGDFIMADIIQIDISSSVVREWAGSGWDICYLVPEKVEKYIRENKLYSGRGAAEREAAT